MISADRTWLSVGLAAGLAVGLALGIGWKNRSDGGGGGGGLVRHVVLLKFKEDVPISVVSDFIAQAKLLRQKIPEIQTYEVGSDIGLDGSANHDLAIAASFSDKAGYSVYATHPEHVKVVQIIKPWLIAGGRVAAQIHP